MADYKAAMAGQPLPVGAQRARPGTMTALALSYFASPEFRALKQSTQRARRWLIERLCREHGDKRAADMRRDHVVKLMARLKPGAANGLRRALRGLMRHAVDIGLRSDDPTRDVKAVRIKTDGHHSWSDGEIAQFELCHHVGSRARLALALLLYTGQRRGDVIRMGAQHMRDVALYVKQEKTGAELVIPTHPELAAVIAATPSEHLTFLTTRYGGPFTATALSNWFREQCDKRGFRIAPRTVCARPRRGAWPKPAAPRTKSGPSLARKSGRTRALHKGGGSASAGRGGHGQNGKI